MPFTRLGRKNSLRKDTKLREMPKGGAYPVRREARGPGPSQSRAWLSSPAGGARSPTAGGRGGLGRGGRVERSPEAKVQGWAAVPPPASHSTPASPTAPPGSCPHEEGLRRPQGKVGARGQGRRKPPQRPGQGGGCCWGLGYKELGHQALQAQKDEGGESLQLWPPRPPFLRALLGLRGPSLASSPQR